MVIVPCILVYTYTYLNADVAAMKMSLQMMTCGIKQREPWCCAEGAKVDVGCMWLCRPRRTRTLLAGMRRWS